DAGADGGVDGGNDAGVDGGNDAALDGGNDAGVDGGVDGGNDAGVDGGNDAGVDGGNDAGADASVDGGKDAASADAGRVVDALPPRDMTNIYAFRTCFVDAPANHSQSQTMDVCVYGHIPFSYSGCDGYAN